MSLVVVMSVLPLVVACAGADKNPRKKTAPSTAKTAVVSPSQGATATQTKPVANTAPAKPEVPIVIPDSADQLIFGFHANLTTDQGVARGTVVADSALMYSDATRAELRRITVSFVNSAGIKIGTLTAARGTLLVNKSTLTVRGNVIATGADNRRLETTRATFNIVRNVLVGDTAYELSGGPTPTKTRGATFELDSKLTKPVVVNPAVAKPAVDRSKAAKASATTTPAAKPSLPAPAKPVTKPPA